MSGRGQLHRVLKPCSVSKLADAYVAGRHLYVPLSTANAPHLEVVLGLEQTARLVETFGGDYVYLPGLENRPTDGVEKPPTLEEVEELTRLGFSATKIAAQFGCSERSIYYKRQRLRKARSNGQVAK